MIAQWKPGSPAGPALLAGCPDDGGTRTLTRSELSLSQEQIWLDDQINPGTAVYNIPIALHFQGPLDADVLERSLSEIVRRHEVLRATFPAVCHRPIQLVSHDQAVTLAQVDLSDGEAANRMERVVQACEEECRRPLDLLAGSVLRFVLYRLSARENVLLMTVHHIVFDGWSLGIFLKELASLLAAFSAGLPSPLPELSIRHSEFALEQRASLQGEVLEQLMGFWRKNLEGIPPHLALPFDRPLQSGRHYRGGRHPLVLGEELTQALKNLSRDEGATLYMTLVAGLAALLYRYTGQTDVVLAHRRRRECRPRGGR